MPRAVCVRAVFQAGRRSRAERGQGWRNGCRLQASSDDPPEAWAEIFSTALDLPCVEPPSTSRPGEDDRIQASANQWLQTVRRLRLDHTWDDIARCAQAAGPQLDARTSGALGQPSARGDRGSDGEGSSFLVAARPPDTLTFRSEMSARSTARPRREPGTKTFAAAPYAAFSGGLPGYPPSSSRTITSVSPAPISRTSWKGQGRARECAGTVFLDDHIGPGRSQIDFLCFRSLLVCKDECIADQPAVWSMGSRFLV